MINLITDMAPDAQLEDMRCFNHVVAWFLRKAFEKQGHQCSFVESTENTIPPADHTIVISWYARARRMCNPGYYKTVRAATKRKLALYIDSDVGVSTRGYDVVFTVIPPLPQSLKAGLFVYAGWGADPEHCYPDQDPDPAQRTVFLDRYQRLEKRGGGFRNMWATYQKVLPGTGMRIVRATGRLRWHEMQSIFRKTHYYCCTQLGESGLTRIEAATCGAVLIVPKPLYRPRTMSSLVCRIWRGPNDLVAALNQPTKPARISQIASHHTWDLAAKRIIQRLERR